MASRRRRRGYPQLATHPGDLLDSLAIGIAVGLFVLITLSSTGVPRALLTLAFTVFVPGRAIVTNLPWFARWSPAAMAMILSISVISLLAAVSLWAHAWQPVRAFQAEAVASVIGLGCGVVRRNRLLDAALGRHQSGSLRPDEPGLVSSDSGGPETTGVPDQERETSAAVPDLGRGHS